MDAGAVEDIRLDSSTKQSFDRITSEIAAPTQVSRGEDGALKLDSSSGVSDVRRLGLTTAVILLVTRVSGGVSLCS